MAWFVRPLCFMHVRVDSRYPDPVLHGLGVERWSAEVL